MSQEKNGVILTSAFIGALGLIGAAWVLGVQFKYFHKTGEITVKGVAQKYIKSDEGAWLVAAEVHGDTYSDTIAQLRQNMPIIKDFLLKQGFTEDNLGLNQPQIEVHYDEKQTEHGYTRVENGFDGRQSFGIITRNLPLIKKAMNNALDFRSQNPFVRFESPQYYISNLAEIKQNMISTATADAYSRAEKFAQTGHARVGQMRSASQGAFNIYSTNISDRDREDSYGGTYDTSSVKKQVRLVVTIRYGIE